MRKAAKTTKKMLKNFVSFAALREIPTQELSPFLLTEDKCCVYFIPMVGHPKSYTSPIAETTGSYKFWKDVSFFGCIMSGILLGIVVFKLLSPENGIPKVREVTRIKKQLETEIEQVKAENAQMEEHIEAMQTDPFWQEKIAREELNMALPEEIIYKFTE